MTEESGNLNDRVKNRLQEMGLDTSDIKTTLESLNKVMFITHIREDLVQFVKAMETVMFEHDEDKENSWYDSKIEDLIEGLNNEVREFRQAEENFNIKQMQHELVDIANYCMMIRARLGDENEEG